jgi:hypothetical protein
MGPLKFLSLLAVLPLFSQTVAASPADASARIAEFVWGQAADAFTLKEFVEQSGMTTQHKREALGYLEFEKMESAALPSLSWKFGSSALKLGEGKAAFEVDFTKLPKGPLLVNGTPMSIDPMVRFSDLVTQVQRTLNSKKSYSALQFLIPEASAKQSSLLAVLGAVTYWTGSDKALACMGYEGNTRSNCDLWSDAGMILANSKRGILDFTCEGDRFSSFRYQSRLAEYTLSARHDRQGQLTKLTVLHNGEVTCDYEIQNGKFKSLIDTSGLRNYCDGRAEGSYSHGTLNPGEKIKRVSHVAVPIERLESCCKSEACKKEIFAAVKKSPAGSTQEPATAR